MAGFEQENSALSGTPSRRRADTPMEAEVRTESLERYLIQTAKEMLCPKAESDFPTSAFARTATEEDSPVLRSDQTNHIITYTGAFNPPHKGHINILADGFYNSGPGLNIVSAFVVPIGDDALRAKEDARKGPSSNPHQVMLTRSQRAELLTTHLHGADELRELACKAKVWRFPELEPIAAYMRRVVELAAAEGFDVEFVSLKGPDHLWFDRPIKHPALIICRKIIFSDTSRANEDLWTSGHPTPLVGGWSPWSEISSVEGDDGLTRSVWECALANSPGSVVRLLTDDNKAEKPDTSSSRIRKIILESSVSESLESLVPKLSEANVICPKMLARFLYEDAD